MTPELLHQLEECVTQQPWCSVPSAALMDLCLALREAWVKIDNLQHNLRIEVEQNTRRVLERDSSQ